MIYIIGNELKLMIALNHIINIQLYVTITFFSAAEEAPFFIIPDLRWRLELLLIGILLEDLALDILVMAENSDSSDVKSSS